MSGTTPVVSRWRPAAAVETEPIAELGEAVIQLLRGTLPPPPPGTWWYFALSGGPQTVAMRDPASLGGER